MSYIELEDISFSYPDSTEALKNVSFSINKGEKIVVLGENGSGKSTLFLLLSGLLKPLNGSYSLNNKIIKSKKDRKNLVGIVGLTFQNPDIQLFAPTVYQEVSYGPLNLKLKDDVLDTRINNALESTGLTHLINRPIQYLSYGQKKKVSIASILSMEAEIIILDEPFAWLDLKGRREMNKILGNLTAMGKTVIISTHDVDFAWKWSDQLIIFKEGHVIRSGPARELFIQKNLLEQANINQPDIIKISYALGITENIPSDINELSEIINHKEKISI